MSFYEKIKYKLKKYQEEAPDRAAKREERLEDRRERKEKKLQHELEVATMRERISHTKASGHMASLGVQERRQRLIQKRRESVPQMPSLFSMGSSLPKSPVYGAKPRKAKPKKRKAKPRKK